MCGIYRYNILTVVHRKHVYLLRLASSSKNHLPTDEYHVFACVFPHCCDTFWVHVRLVNDQLELSILLSPGWLICVLPVSLSRWCGASINQSRRWNIFVAFSCTDRMWVKEEGKTASLIPFGFMCIYLSESWSSHDDGAKLGGHSFEEWPKNQDTPVPNPVETPRGLPVCLENKTASWWSNSRIVLCTRR